MNHMHNMHHTSPSSLLVHVCKYWMLRATLVCLLALAKNCIFVLEQPVNSLASRWKRFEWMINHVAWVF